VKTAIVIGGGIAGPVVASALRLAGIEATVYERHQHTADGIGGTLGLAPNGVAALRVIGADEAVVAIGTPVTRQVMAVGGKRIEMPRLAGVAPMRLVHRSDLFRVLHDHAAVPVVYGKELVDAVETPTAITAHFADGSTATADMLIGADGVRSTVRRLIDPHAPGPRYTGVMGFEVVARKELDVPPGTMTFTFGKRGYYLYVPSPGGGTRLGVNLPQQRPYTIAEARAVPSSTWMETLLSVYGEDTPARELLLSSDPAEFEISGSAQIMPPVPHWHRGRMVLVGDAAHAPSNSSGQGASLAIESAIELARCLRDIPDIPVAYAAFERLRRARVEKIAAQAARINRVKAPGPVARTLMPVLMPLVLKMAMRPEKSLAPILRHKIDWTTPALP
jgi:2-polyprenyl-6-methoxyphenol hydroxylase-like FAD-dependent oxidoreductase